MNNIMEIMRKAWRWAVVRRRWTLPVAGILVAGAFYVGFVSNGNPSKDANRKGQPIVSVQAEAARIGDFPVVISGLGTVTPLFTVTVKSRVEGQLMEVLYREGQMVQKGDLLARIDPRPFEVQLAQAEGQMARDQALLTNARIDLKRYATLWRQDSIPKQQLDTQEALVRQYEGAIKADQAQIDSAKLQLTYCRIIAPVSGRVGLRLVDPGNIVRASDTTGLVVITQLQPITVIFPVPEDNLAAILPRLKSGKSLPVEAYDREMKQRLAVGSLLTADNQIDPATGTVRLKALFANAAHELFPNQFVNARLVVDVRKDVVLVPSTALQRGPQGTFAYVVKADRTVEARSVTAGDTQDGQAVVQKGIAEGELVVVDGAERLREGTKVELRAKRGAAPAPRSGAK